MLAAAPDDLQSSRVVFPLNTLLQAIIVSSAFLGTLGKDVVTFWVRTSKYCLKTTCFHTVSKSFIVIFLFLSPHAAFILDAFSYLLDQRMIFFINAIVQANWVFKAFV